MMKRLLVLLVVLAAVVLPAAAQDFSSPTPQFISFNLGVAIGPELNDDGGIAGGYNFGFDFFVLDTLSVGFDRITTDSNGTGGAAIARAYNGLRLGYKFTPVIGAALGFGATDAAIFAGADPETITLGLFADVLTKRSAAGIAHGLKLRIDYVAPFNELDNGGLLFIVGLNFGV
jgi:opacity protein-like surface antigen